MDWVEAAREFLRTIGIVLGLIKREKEKSDDFKIARGADLEAQAKEQLTNAKIRDQNAGLTDAELDQRLREAGAGRQ